MGMALIPKVSIIIPVYNCDKYIKKCLDSVMCQTYKNIQIIIIDDGSDDLSPEIIDGFRDFGNVIIHQENMGVCIARNNAIKVADGEFLTFVDGDDYIEADYIEKMVEEAVNNDSELVVSGFIIEQADGSKKDCIVPGSYLINRDESWVYRLSSTCGRLYRRDFWNKNSMSFTTEKGVRAEDVPICLFANYAAKNIRTMQYAGYHYVQHENSAMHQFAGLKKYGFPYEAMGWLEEKCMSLCYHNSKEFLDWGIIKFFAHFWYSLGRGAEKETKQTMMDFFYDYVRRVCPEYKRSWKYVKKQSRLPITIWGASQLLIWRLSFEKHGLFNILK